MFNDYHIEKLFDPKSDLGRLYWHVILQSFAVSLIYIFVPVYLLTIGFGLAKVLVYLFVEWTVFGFLAPIYAKIIHRVGLKEIILIRIPLFVLSLILLVLLKDNLFLQDFYYVIAMLSGFSGGLYTLSITSLFAKKMGDKKQGERTAKFFAFPKITYVVGPVVGGVIATYLGFGTLFLFTALLLFVSFFPLSSVRKNIDHPSFDFRVFKRFKSNIKEFFLLGSYGLRSLVLYIILPIAIYFSSRSALSLGLIVSALSLISALFTVYVGKLTDRRGSRNIIRSSAGITALLFLSLGYSLEYDLFVYLALLSGTIGVLIEIPYESHLYNHSRVCKSPLEFLTFKEFSLFFGRLVLFLILIVLESNLDLAFYLGAVSSAVFFMF